MVPGSVNKVWWKCSNGPDHEWQASPNSRTNPSIKSGCPCCSGRKVSVTNSLTLLYPRLPPNGIRRRTGTSRQILLPQDRTRKSGGSAPKGRIMSGKRGWGSEHNEEAAALTAMEKWFRSRTHWPPSSLRLQRNGTQRRTETSPRIGSWLAQKLRFGGNAASTWTMCGKQPQAPNQRE